MPPAAAPRSSLGMRRVRRARSRLHIAIDNDPDGLLPGQNVTYRPFAAAQLMRFLARLNFARLSFERFRLGDCGGLGRSIDVNFLCPLAQLAKRLKIYIQIFVGWHFMRRP